MSKLKIAVIGTGNISRAHVNAYKKQKNVEVTAGCDINERRVKAFCKERDIPNYYTDYKKMLDTEKPDAVSICTWNNSHAKIAIDCLKAGVCVLCEKPLALNHKEAQAIQDAEKESGAFLMVGFVRRFDKKTIIAKDLIDNNRFGKLYYAKTGVIRRCGNPTGWFSNKSVSGGGPLIDLGVHMIDMCRYLMGKPKVISVYGTTFEELGSRSDVKMLDKYRPMDDGNKCDVEDLAVALIRFDNGCVLSIEVSFTLHTVNEKLYCEIFGTEAGAEIAPDFKIAGTMDGYNIDYKPQYTKDKEAFQSMFDRQITHFVDCAANGTKCISPVEDGVELMKILDAVYKSAATGHEVTFK